MSVDQEAENLSEVFHETVHENHQDTFSGNDFDCETSIKNETYVKSSCEAKVVTRFCVGWPSSCKCLKYYQFCKEKNKITYENKKSEKMNLEWLFYSNNFDSEYINRDYVVDSEYSVLHYDEIDEQQYKNKEYKGVKGCFPFEDKPSSKWFFKQENPFTEENFLLTKIRKDFEYLLYLVMIFKDKNEIPMKCWEWGDKLNYSISSGDKQTSTEPSEVDLKEFPFPYEKLNLPNANNRQFLLQYPDKSLKIPAEILVYPKELPRKYTKDELTRKYTEDQLPRKYTEDELTRKYTEDQLPRKYTEDELTRKYTEDQLPRKYTEDELPRKYTKDEFKRTIIRALALEDTLD